MTQYLKKTLNLLINLPLSPLLGIVHEVSCPDRQAVEQHNLCSFWQLPERTVESERFLNCCELLTPLLAVLLDPQLTRHAGVDLEVVDMGVNHHFPDLAGLIKRKVRPGSANMATGPAMSEEEALQALLCGAELAVEAQEAGYHLLGTGEMGIANTTPATALYSVLLDVPVEGITGRGTGIDDERLHHKIAVIKKAIALNALRCTTPLGTLAALGGYEIAAIAGFILGAAAARIPVVVDGFISSAGAVVALKLCPDVEGYLFFSHLSNEQGHRAVMEKLGVRPILDLDLRLGEGTGAAIAMQLIEGAVKIYNEMATFSGAKVSEKCGEQGC